MHWFRENLKLVAAGTGVFQKICRGSLAGEEKNFALGQRSTNPNSGFDSVHALGIVGRKYDVSDDEVWLIGQCEIDSFVSGVYGGSIESSLVEDNSQSVSYDVLIIYHQNARSSVRIRHVTSWMQ